MYNNIRNYKQYVPVLAVMVIVGLLGIGFMYSSQAATVSEATEAERGTWELGASKVTDSTASGSAAIKFGAGAGAALTGAKGIMSMGPPVSGHAYVDYTTTGLDMKWSDLELSDQQFSGTAWSRIDSQVANAAVKSLRLRIYSGGRAPDFVKQGSGPAVSGSSTDTDYDPATGQNVTKSIYIDCSVFGGIAVMNPYDTNVVIDKYSTGCIPYFWTDYYLGQYQQLMNEVKRRYGSNVKLSEVVVSSCSTIYAEPFYRAHKDLSSNTRLYDAGLTYNTDLYCHEQSMTIHNTTFPNKLSSLAINPWEIMDPTKDIGMRRDWKPTYDFAQKWRATMGTRLVLQNNGWGETEGCPSGELPTTNVYCYLKSVAQPKGYQSETWPRLADTGMTSLNGWYSALERAIADGACFIESTDNNYKNADPAVAAAYDAQLEANCSK